VKKQPNGLTSVYQTGALAFAVFSYYIVRAFPLAALAG